MRSMRLALRHLRNEARLARRHREGVRAARRLTGPGLRLNLACGDNAKPGWVNVDLVSEIPLDLREPLPFPDGSAVFAYCEHFLEHLEYEGEAPRFLREIHRVLAPGGTVSVGVPDAEIPLRAYVEGGDYFEIVRRLGFHPPTLRTRMEHVNYHFRQGREHRYAYDEETLEMLLSGVGFEDVRRRDFDPGLDSPVREYGTLYMDARKPG